MIVTTTIQDDSQNLDIFLICIENRGIMWGVTINFFYGPVMGRNDYLKDNWKCF